MNRIFLILLAILPFCIKGQNINDVYNISAVNYQGTAKSAAMGNAMGAVGEDISAISINPAGLGLYRKSSFAFTPSLLTTYTKSEYFGNTEHDNRTCLNINNLGYVVTNKSKNVKVNWAWAMNKTNNFNNRTFVNGFNPNNSLIDAYFAEIIANDIYDNKDLEEYSPLEAMKTCKVPVIFFHGEDDDFVPCSMSRANFEACAARKKLVTIPGAGHGLAFPMEPERYLRELKEFFGPEATYQK